MVSCKNVDKLNDENKILKRCNNTGIRIFQRSIYHWKTTFDLNQEEKSFLQKHNISRIYIRMFDVCREWNGLEERFEVVPVATTKFKSNRPDSIEIIPTVFITLEALMEYTGKERDLSSLIVTRVLAMCSWNELGPIKEIQYDCDWTAHTKESFARLCQSTKELLLNKGIALSGTIRLHQIEEAEYPFDIGVLMMYNTGNFKDVNTRNSILDFNDVKKYMMVENRIKRFKEARSYNCKTISVAYPIFSWGVEFDDKGQFSRLISDYPNDLYDSKYKVKYESSDINEILKVRYLVDSTIGKCIDANILYHLDSDNLKKYTSDEI